MYSNNKVNAVFFKNGEGSPFQHTDKVFYGRLSVPVKTGKKDEDGKEVFAYENWDARFVGDAKAVAEKLDDKARVTVTEWAAHPGYNREKKTNYPYVMVMGIEVRKEG